MSDPLRHWSAATVDIAAQLLEREGRARSDTIARELGRPERTIRQTLSRLHSGRLVTRVSEHTREPGRPAWVYYLSDEQVPGAERAVNTPAESWDSLGGEDVEHAEGDEDRDRTGASPAFLDGCRDSRAAIPARSSLVACGHLARGQELVLVDISGAGLSDLLELLAGTRTIHGAAWIARIGDELAIAFETTETSSGAADLLAVVAGARLPVRLAVVTQVAPVDALIEQAKRIAPEIRRARSEHDAHSAPH